MSAFAGLHMGTGLTDQPEPNSYGADLDYSEKKPELRDGKRKNQLRGYTSDITSIIDLNIGGEALIGVVVNGVLSIYPVADMLEQIRRYYAWNEVKETFTWNELEAAKSWNDLIDGER